MGTGLANTLKYSLLIDSRNGWFYTQRIAMSLSVLIIFILTQSSDNNANGLKFILAIFNIGFFITTFATCHIFYTAIVAEKENGVLPLLMMTGIKPLSYISSKFVSRFSQLSSLLLVLLPPTLFAVTLGGITTKQILLVYSYLLIWLIYVSCTSLWASVLFKEKKEAAAIASIITVSSFLLLWMFQASPLSSLNDIISSQGNDFSSHTEIYLLLALSLLFFHSCCKNLQYGVLFPISFIDDHFQKIKKKRFKNKVKNIKKDQNIRIRFPRKLPIVAKDKYLVEMRNLFSSHPLLIILMVLSIFTPFIILLIMWILIGPILLTWKRVIEVFSHEIEENTFSSLMMLPMNFEELLKEKLNSACQYQSIYASYAFLSLPMIAGSIASESFHIIFAALLLPFLYLVIVYSTAFTVFKTREMVKITSFCISLCLIFIYFFVPFVSILFGPAAYYLRKMLIKELRTIAEMSD